MAPWIWNDESDAAPTPGQSTDVDNGVGVVTEPVVAEPTPTQSIEAEWLDVLQHDPSQLQHMSVDKLRQFDEWLEVNPDAPAAGNLRGTVHYLANIE